jgi:N-acetylglucosamine malate deacetylase 1
MEVKKVLIVAPHPDDETLGCGGTILKHISNGDKVVWLIINSVSVENGFTQERVESRKSEIDLVADLYGFHHVKQLGFPTMQLQKIDETLLINSIAEVIRVEEPQIIYLPNRSDAHSDHRITFNAVMACTKSFRNPFLRKVLMYECISETEFAPAFAENVFLPNYFNDISLYFDKKLEIMRIYSSELGNHPFPRSEQNINALAVHRGSQAGVRYAEAFQLVKFIDK